MSVGAIPIPDLARSNEPTGIDVAGPQIGVEDLPRSNGI
jgi:hypothetical protein